MLTSLPSFSRLNQLASDSNANNLQQSQQMQQYQPMQPTQPIYPSFPQGQGQAQYGGGGYQVQPYIGYTPQQHQQIATAGPGPSYNQHQQVAPYGQQQQQLQQQQQRQQIQYGQGQGQQGYAVNRFAGGPSNVSPTTQMQSRLQPQQLESVGKDEDPIYGPLSRARNKITRALVGDEESSGDLADGFQHPLSQHEPYQPLPSNAGAFKPARVTKRTPLPDALHQELNYKHLTAKMGLFEEIERAWFTVDNKLFLWDYSDGRDFSRYDEQNDTIQAVGLVKARKDVFVDEITHVLVICTSSKATLLGLSRPANSREISLYHTNLSVETPSAMIDIKGTSAGRIFMLGANKDLYELDYSSDASWFFGSSTKVGLHNRSSGSLANWTPGFLTSKTKEGIELFAVDSQQGRLYTIHTNGEIEWIDVSGARYETRAKFSRVKQELNRNVQVGNVTPIGLAAIGGHESRRACVVITGSNGVRLYLGLNPVAYGSSLQVLATRTPVPTQANLPVAAQTFYSSGTFISVQHDTNAPLPQTQLNIAVQLVGRQSALRENYDITEGPACLEWTSTEIIPSQVWNIVELPSANPAFFPPSLTASSGIALSELPRQATTQAREFLVLATSGLFWISQPRPIDILQDDLELEKDAAINTVRMSFGKSQLAAMSLQLGATSDLKQADLASAISTILVTSGEPIIKDGTGGKNIYYSGRHDGLAIIIARYLRPIWNVKVTLPVGPGRLALGVPESLLLAVQGRLEKLKRYLDEHPFQRYQAEGEAKIAWDQEDMSIHGLQVLLKQAVEAISFILLLSDYKISDIIAKTDMNTQNTLSNLTFQDLLTSSDGREVARKLVTSLIEQQIGQELGIDTLSEILQQRCGSFCQPGDVVMYKAEESMRRAEGSRDYAERSESLTESLRLFTRTAGTIPISRLQEVSRRYRAMQYTVGAIELPLKTAVQLDPNDKAVDFVRDGEHPQDPRKALFEARKQCYEMVIDALGMFDELLDKATAEGNTASATQKRDEAYALAIASDDELFHFYLYDWHVERGLQEQLLEFDTPYIEQYLKLTINNVEDRRDLLWKFYARREDYLPAAEALSSLATRPSPMVLHDRLYYLAQALTSAKSAASLGSEDVEFTSRLQEQIDVAQVQMEVCRAVEVHPEMTGEEKNDVLAKLNTDLLQLDELYQSFARPLRLYEPILLILKTADTRIDDVCEAVWRQLLSSYRVAGATALDEAVVSLVRRYFPSEAAPLDIMVPVVYAEAQGAVGGQAGWASSALLEGGVPLRDLWEAGVGLYENSDDDERDYYAEELSVIASRWIGRKDEIPAAEVERFASAYLLRISGAQLDEAKRETKDRLTAAKQAAVRY
ncbi:nuclear pore complex protein Nup155 [Kwoniella heveanensis BCC8398]|uniref:Nuclear pore complex protein Nup155 n=1 Tax=Kwoniella heveanensis BCC8398 TaxID=1296120 RepID=A0A1B9H2Q2_9TREE|nr:nuclear pore complex protein Nup155 [Kwoniella heveanensis BCC8398]